MGMAVVCEAAGEKQYNVQPLQPDEYYAAKTADILLVSLYWWDNLLDFVRFLTLAGINAEKRKPVIVIGGINACNTAILRKYFHYAILGDGEVVIAEVLRRIIAGEDAAELDGVVSADDIGKETELLVADAIPPHTYTELRSNKIARVELARGCQNKCPFCQLAWTKPYREQAPEIVCHLVRQSKTKKIGLFAPNRGNYSGLPEVMNELQRQGKTNAAEDVRLDDMMKMRTISNIKFGVEGFSERIRKKIGKVRSNEELVEGFRHIFNVLRTPTGKPVSTATIYMIADMPGETPEDTYEFFEVLREIDALCDRKFTLYIAVNSFIPAPFTPWEREAINPYSDFNETWRKRPRLKNIVVAERAGLKGPSVRIAQALTLRGDERLGPVLYCLANDGRKLIRDRSRQAGETVEKLISMTGCDPQSVTGRIPKKDPLPHSNYKVAV